MVYLKSHCHNHDHLGFLVCYLLEA
jgi:hypothetical protein